MRFDQAISGSPIHCLTTAWDFESFTIACKFKSVKTPRKSWLTDPNPKNSIGTLTGVGSMILRTTT